MKSEKSTRFPITIKRGSVVVKIYCTPTHGCERFTLSYYHDGQRKRPSFGSLENARLEAEFIASRLASSQAAVLNLTGADLSAYQRAKQHLDPIGVAIEVAAAKLL